MTQSDSTDPVAAAQAKAQSALEAALKAQADADAAVKRARDAAAAAAKIAAAEQEAAVMIAEHTTGDGSKTDAPAADPASRRSRRPRS